MQQSNSQKVLKGISSQTIVTLLIGIVEIGSFSIMSRLLSKDDFGYFAALIAVTSIFSALSETGIGSAIVQKKNPDNQFFNNAFTLSFLIGLILMALLCGFSGMIANLIVDNSIRLPLMIISCTLLLSCVTSVPRSILHKQRMFYRMGLTKLFSLFFSTCVAICLALKGFGYYSILVRVVLDGLLVYLISLFLAKTQFHFAWNWIVIKKIFNFSGWLMAGSLFRNLANSVDSLIMPRLLSVTMLGAYNRPKGFINQISSQLNGIFDSALFPVLSEMQDDKDAIKNAYKTSVYFMNVFAMLLSLFFIFNGDLIIRIFFGEQWLNVRIIFVILSVSLIMNIDGRLNDCYLRSLALTKAQFVFRVAEFSVNLIFMVIGSKWGIVGFAIGCVCANGLMTFAKMFYLNKKIFVSSFEIVKCIISSWSAGFVIIPLMICIHAVMPNSFFGNLISCICLFILFFIIFIFFPSIVGKKYKDNVYPKINEKLNQLIGRKTW
jgi:PST family polysaccharide transporter